MKKIQSIRGMNDMLPNDSAHWQNLEHQFAQLVSSYGFHEIRTPIVESTNLFKRSIGEATDIVEKEMYTFADRNSDSLTLRPEGTASIVRAMIEHGLLQTRQKLWYHGEMFRHERPQKGRYRQFFQLGCEVFGLADAPVDAELIALTARLWHILGISDVELQINSLGSAEARASFCQKLIDYFSSHANKLDEDSTRRLNSNPLRILDSKNPEMQTLVQNAPKLSDYLDDDSKAHFESLRTSLDTLGIAYVINHRLVRGTDYYNKTVFEWVTTKLGAQGTICAGGRYDSLVEQLGGKPTPAVGFAIGQERILALMDEPTDMLYPDFYLVLKGDNALQKGMILAEQVRKQFSNLQLITNFDGGSFKNQFKRADKSNARLAIVIGEDEIHNDTVVIKYLRSDKEQITLNASKLNDWIAENL